LQIKIFSTYRRYWLNRRQAGQIELTKTAIWRHAKYSENAYKNRLTIDQLVTIIETSATAAGIEVIDNPPWEV